jgi:hypothetical protein
MCPLPVPTLFCFLCYAVLYLFCSSLYCCLEVSSCLKHCWVDAVLVRSDNLLSRASRARLKAITTQKYLFQKLLVLYTLRLSSSDWLSLRGGRRGEVGRRVFLWVCPQRVGALVTVDPWWWPRYGWPVEGGLRVLLLHGLSGRWVCP